MTTTTAVTVIQHCNNLYPYFPNNITAGNAVIVVNGGVASGVVTAVAPFIGSQSIKPAGSFAVWNNGTTNCIQGASGLIGSNFIAIWVLPNCPAVNGITVPVYGASAQGWDAYEVSGLGSTPVVDIESSASGPEGSTHYDSGGITTRVANSIVFGEAYSNGGFGSVPGTPWVVNAEISRIAGYQILSAVASLDWAGTLSSVLDPWTSGIVAIASAAPPPVSSGGSGNLSGNTAPAIIYSGDEDRFRFIVEEAVTGTILSRDLTVTNPKVMRVLSGPANIEFDIDYRDTSNSGIYFKPWGHWIHVEKQIYGERVIWASGLVQPSDVDKKTGITHMTAQGFSGYAKKMPWLENWNPIACDVFEVVHKVWAHLMSFPTGNLGITVTPALSGIEMLPGYAFDGNILNFDFFAEFIRATDKQDCADHVDKLARDIPFDYREMSAWNADRSAITKQIALGYPKIGVNQDWLTFIINENVMEAVPHVETQIDWVSDVIIDGWFPGTEYSAQLTNADPKRYRRVISQDDARINSNERAAAWSKKKLTRRQTPAYWDSIVVDMGHPSAPFGTYDVGDRINIRGIMPYIGYVQQQHKILAIMVDEQAGSCELTLKAEGAFNYDPIYYAAQQQGSVQVTVKNTPTIYVQGSNPVVGAS